MDKQALLDRKQKAEQEYTQLEARMAELRGEWRVLNDLINGLEENKVSPEANVIDVNAALEEQDAAN